MEESEVDAFRWRMEESHSQLGAPRARLCLANPAMLHATRLFPPFCSVNMIDFARIREGDSDELEGSLLPLIGSVDLIDQKIHTELMQRDFEHALLSVQLITTSSTRKAELIMQQILRYKILESVAWASGETDTTPTQYLHELQVDLSDQDHIDLGLTNWKSTVGTFCATFRNETGSVPPTHLVPQDRITASLVHKIQQSGTSRHLSTVISNMCGAALGLRGLILLGKAYYSSNSSNRDKQADVMELNESPLLPNANTSDLVSALMSIRRRTTITLHALYNGLFHSWGSWTPFRILVVRDLWAVLWRLAREGGEHCHDILYQLVAKWNDICKPNPQYDVPIERDASTDAMLSKHISLANKFVVSLDTIFSQFQGVRKTRRQKEQIELDELHALDGNSSTKMNEVWALWESHFIQAKITPAPVQVPQVRQVTLHKWAWNQRAASCPPLHRSFRRQVLKPLDHTYVFPEAPRKREKYIFHPFTDEERTFLLPYRHPKKDITTEPDRPATSQRVLQKIPEPIATSLCKTTPTDSRQLRVVPDPEATPVVETPALSKVKAKTSGGVGGGGGGGGGGRRSYPKRRAVVTPGLVPSITKPIDATESSSPAPDVKDEQPLVLPHRIWDVVDVDVGPHEANALVGVVNVVLGTKDVPVNMLFQFYSGMKSDLTRTLAILHAVARGVSWEGYEADLRKMEFDLRESITHEIKLVSQEEWDNAPIKEQRHTFSLNNVEVVGVPLIAVLPNVSSLTSMEEISLVLDLDKPLLCQDHTLARQNGEGLEYRNRKSSISSFLSIADSNRAATDEGHPQTSTVLSFCGLSDGMTVLDDRPESFSWATPVPSILGIWAHMSHVSAVTVTRHDHGGVCTWLHVAVGELLCFVASERKGNKGAGALFMAGLTPGGVVDEDLLYWTCLRVSAGNDLYLRPGSLYHIVTVADTIGVGGHFFSASHFTRTLETVIVEHFHIDDSADPEQSRVHIALFKVLRKYVDGIASNQRLPNARQFASLILLCAILDQLPPKTHPKHKKMPVWIETSEFSIDHGFALTYVTKIASLLRPLDTYQKRRIVRRMHLQWRLCQELHKWCVTTFGATTRLRGTKKVLLDIPHSLEDLLSGGEVSTILDTVVDENNGELGLYE
ncbi:hypothetical protein SCHPADRAFT_894232 [Schizopora paradoxa]|uniref:JmjC domain-containing protein n=1 Tax=Schizopora paradoxa TaxID=27342 RepID=A0A0H2R809_9AGAM|nr:hypothetical protein SCHPADRAFT_894232 [Schizopora paradoxa]